MDLPEYRTTQPRTHAGFGGRDGLKECEKIVRTRFLVHIVVPGRKQRGPVAIVGRSYRDALPAASFVISLLQMETTILVGRVQIDVKNGDDPISGRWHVHNAIRPNWLFQSTHWSVLSCPLMQPVIVANSTAMVGQELMQKRDDEYGCDANVLTKCMDNVVFRAGGLKEFDVFSHECPPMAFAGGSSRQVQMLFQEVISAMEEKE